MNKKKIKIKIERQKKERRKEEKKRSGLEKGYVRKQRKSANERVGKIERARDR